MQFKKNADVLTPEGEKIGRVDRVVIDPAGGAVTHLVVQKGFLFTTDKVVPIDHVDVTGENLVVLTKSDAVPEDYPDFEETEYIVDERSPRFRQPESRDAAQVIWYHTRIGMPWWGFGPDPHIRRPPYVKQTERNIPEGTKPLQEGAQVVDSAGETVGKVEEVFAEADEHRVTHLLVSSGIVFKERKMVPSIWIGDLQEEMIRLTIPKEVIERLPQANPAGRGM